jgi:hypothetical protein
MEAVRSSETSVDSNQTTRRYVLEDRGLDEMHLFAFLPLLSNPVVSKIIPPVAVVFYIRLHSYRR